MKLIIGILASITALLLMSLTTIDPSCIDTIKTGKFYIEVQPGDTLFIERTETEQIETYKNTKLYCDLQWTKSNEYILTFKKCNEPSCLKKGDKMNISILECNDTNYKTRLTSENCGIVEVTIMRYTH